MRTKQDIINAISKVQHPAIACSLLDLGIVKDVAFNNNKATITFAFPFPNIPIAEQLVNSIYDPIDLLGVEFGYSIIVMTEEEKARFMQMEVDKWKGNINTNA